MWGDGFGVAMLSTGYVSYTLNNTCIKRCETDIKPYMTLATDAFLSALAPSSILCCGAMAPTAFEFVDCPEMTA